MADRKEEGRTISLAFDRARFEGSLETLVAGNRFTIAVVFPLVGVALLVSGATGVLPRALAFHPLGLLVGVAVMRLPLVAGVLPAIDMKAAGLLAGLSGYAYLIEYIGLQTGWPYGEFAYGVDLGPTVADVPIGLPLLFLPLVLNAYLLAILVLGSLANRSILRLPTALAVLLAIDLVLDPGAVAIGFWTYAEGGVFYGVPLTNYLGWLLSGTIALVAFDLAFDRTVLLERLRRYAFMLDDLVSFVLLWGLVNLAFGNWIPVGIACTLAVALTRTDRFDASAFRLRS